MLTPALPAYFISDLHLMASRPDLTRGFEQFLNNIAVDAKSLFILGDFFDVWVGDDNNTRFIRQVKEALKAVSERGVALYFVHGNRDFLIGERFANDCGMMLLAEQTAIELNGSPTVIMHGDELCLDDVHYQAFRTKVRTAKWQDEVLAKPLWLRRLYAAYLRFRSRRANKGKDEFIMDVNKQAVADSFREHQVKRMIHGHTHRPATHHHEVDGKACERIVLGDWGQYGWYLKADGNALDLIKFKIEN